MRANSCHFCLRGLRGEEPCRHLKENGLGTLIEGLSLFSDGSAQPLLSVSQQNKSSLGARKLVSQNINSDLEVTLIIILVDKDCHPSN